MAVAIRSPFGENFAALTAFSWGSGPTSRLRVATSQTAALQPLRDVKRSRVESGEKSTPLISPSSSSAKTISDLSGSHTITSPRNVPAAIHLPSFEAETHRTYDASILAISSPSSTRHTRTPFSPLLTRYPPPAANVAADSLSPPSMSMSVERSCPMVSINACQLPLVSTHRPLSTMWSQCSRAMVRVNEQVGPHALFAMYTCCPLLIWTSAHVHGGITSCVRVQIASGCAFLMNILHSRQSRSSTGTASRKHGNEHPSARPGESSRPHPCRDTPHFIIVDQ